MSGLTVMAQRQVGGDISLLTKYETNGAKYFGLDGQPITDMLGYLKQEGLNAMRVRLFVDPSKASTADKGDGVVQDLEYVKALGRRIKDAGMSFMLDFHYSDSWADPSKQWTPDDWKTLSDTQLQQQIYDYTKNCLQQLASAGAEPDYIQTGNEISYGILWGTQAVANDGKKNRCFMNSSQANWERFANLLKQAGKACREVCPQAKIILHSERVANTGVLSDFISRMASASVDYDIVGLSYYPYHHGFLPQLEKALQTVETNAPDKDIMIVETGYYYAWQPDNVDFDYSATYPISPAGQQAFTKALVEQLSGHPKVIGLYWWMMEASENGLDWNTKRVTNGWYNASLFNDSEKVKGKDGITYDYPGGKAMPALGELKNFLGSNAAIATVMRTAASDGRYYDLQGRQIKSGAAKTVNSNSVNSKSPRGLYIYNGKKYVGRAK